MYLGFQFDGSRSGVWNLHHYLVAAAEHAMPDDPTIHGWRKLPFEDVTYSIESVVHEIFTHKVVIQFSNTQLENREPCERYIQLPNLSNYIKLTDADLDWYVQGGWDFMEAPKLAVEMLKSKLEALGITGDHLESLEALRIQVDGKLYLGFQFKSYSFQWDVVYPLPAVAEGVSEDVSIDLTFSDNSNTKI